MFRRPSVRPFRRRPRRALRLEQLETRLAPATFQWTGAAGNNWNNPGDWLLNGVPGLPTPMSDLVFPGGVAQTAIVNDIPNPLSGPVAYNSLLFSDVTDNPGYVITGLPITLGDPSVPGSGTINVQALVPNVDIQLPIQLAGPSGTREFVTVGGAATLTLDGALSGTTNAELTKEGAGTLVLAADNRAFTGPITVDVNGGILQITNRFALGDNTSNPTTIQTNGQLQVADLQTGLQTQVVPQNLILNGAGPDNNGALVNLSGQNFWGGNIVLDSDTTVGALAGSLTIDGVISDTGHDGSGITKEGPGEVVFTQADTYRGGTTVNNGVLDIQNALALGAGDGTAATGTVVTKSTDKNASLWVDDPTGVGFTVPNELLTLNGVGAAPVQAVTVKGNAGTFFTLTFPEDGPYNYPLPNPAWPIFTTNPLPANASAAQVQAALNNLLDIALVGGFVDVTETTSPAGNRYEILFGGTFADIAVPAVPQLIGTGIGGASVSVVTVRNGDEGALRNVNAFNTWTGNVILGSPLPDEVAPAIGAAEASGLTITGVVQDPVPPPAVAAPTPLIKVDFGTLIFASATGIANTYAGGTYIQAGILEIEDSQGAGAGAITVQDGGSFAIGVDNIPDSVTGTTNTRLVKNDLSMSGLGASVLGSLVNMSGVNTYAGSISLIDLGLDDIGPDFNRPGSPDSYDPLLDEWQTEPPGTIENPFVPGDPEDPIIPPDPTPFPEGSDDTPESGSTTKTDDQGSIGVQPDPNPTSGTAYFPTYDPVTGQALSGDYSLTITGKLIGSEPLDKYGGGQLILPNASPDLTSNINIVQGWITIENSHSLGATIPNADQNLQPTVTVEQGAALHLKGSATNPVDITQNLVLDGQGINHTFGDINQQGALESISGINTVRSNVTLEGQAGIGVEHTFGPSQLYLSGHLYDQPIVHSIAAHSPGGPGEVDNFYDTGATSGTITLSYDMYGSDSMDVYYGIKGQGGVLIATTGGPVSGTDNFYATGTPPFSVPYGPTGGETSTIIEIVMDAGGTNQLSTQWYYTALIAPNPSPPGGIVKLGSQLLVIQADGTYLGNVDIRQGVLLDQNNTGLGAGAPLGTPTSSDPTVTVETGAALALTSFVLPSSNGSTNSGVDVWGEHLILNGPGNDTLGEPLGAINVLATDDLTAPNDTTIVPADALWRGPATLNSSSTFNLDAGTRLLLLGNMDDASNPSVAGSDLVKVGDGELVLSGSNSYRGNTYVGSPISPASFPVVPNDAPLPDVQTFEFSGSTGTFNLVLTFGGSMATTAVPLAFGSTAAQVQAAVGGLVTALAISGATVTATQTGSYYTVVLGGSLAGNTPALLTVSPVSGDIVTPVPTVTTTQGGDPSLYFFNSTQGVDGGIVTVANGQGLGTASGNVVVQSGSSLQLEANTTVAGKNLVVAGNGVPTVGDPLGVNWFAQGPAPITNATTLGKNKAIVSGYVTDVAVDPTDPLTIFISTAGGGVWKTENGGKTWRPIWNDALSSYVGVIALDPSDPLHVYAGTGLQDNSVNSFAGTGVYESFDGGATWELLTNGDGSNPFFGRAVTAIAFDPFDPENNPANATTRAGPVVYISDSDQTVDGFNGQNGAPDPAIGVYRYDPQAGTARTVEGVPSADKLFNLTNVASYNRKNSANNFKGFNNTTPGGAAGPEDDYRIDFPQTQGTWSDIKIQNGVLFAAMGADIGVTDALDSANSGAYPGILSGGTSGPGWDTNAVYTLPLWQVFYPAGSVFDNLYSDSFAPPPPPKSMVTTYGYPNVVWFIGNGYIENNPADTTFAEVQNIDGETSLEFPSPFTGSVQNGYIKLTTGPNTVGPIDSAVVFAVDTFPSFYTPVIEGALHGQLAFIADSSVDYVNNGAESWGTLQLPTFPAQPWGVFGDAAEFGYNLPAQGFYDAAIYYDATAPDGLPHLYLAGSNYFLETTPTPTLALGRVWVDHTVDTLGNAPYPDFHALHEVDLPDGTQKFYVATDGGVWQYDWASNDWTDLNGNLMADTRVNGVTSTPNDPTSAIAGVQADGLVQFSDNLTWAQDVGSINPAPFGYLPYGGPVVENPQNPAIMYGFVTNNEEINPTDGTFPDWFHPGISLPTSTLYKSTNGGKTWVSTGTPQLTGAPILFTQNPDPALYLDPTNPARLLVGGNPFGTVIGQAVLQSLDGAGTWLGLDPNGLLVDPTTGLPVTITALAASQIQGVFKFDPSFPQVADLGANTYDPRTIYVTDGLDVWVTKNLGTLWKLRDPPVTGTIVDLEVDPRNRDIVYALDSNDHLFVSTNAGFSWTDISGTGSAKLPTGTTVHGWKMQIDPRTGFLYVGTDDGVWVSTSGGTSWQPFGIGLANTQVRSMVLNETENTLTIGTYGRGTYQAWLDTTQPESGAFSALPGSTGVWSGTVQLAGATTLGATSIYDALQTGFPTSPASNDQYDAQAIDNGYPIGSLTIGGTISDQIAGADWGVTKIGLGNVILGGSNTFGGTATIQEGALVVHNPQALGQTGVADVQQITLSNATPGLTTYTLTFGAFISNGILYTGTPGSDSTPGSDAYTLRTTLQALLTANGLGGTVSVTADPTDTVFTVTFGGDMTGFAQPAMIGTVTSTDAGTAAVNVASGVQVLTLTAPTPGTTTFNLTFNGVTTPTPITYSGTPGPGSQNLPPSDAYEIQTALNSLSSIANVGGAVVVTADPTDTIFTITYAGTLAGFNRAPLSIQVTSTDGAAATILTLPDGAGGTVVEPGQVLELQSSLQGEPVQLNGDGTLFDGHFTGALRNVSNFNTFTGTLILESNSTIGVDSGSQLTLAAPAAILDNGNQYTLTKELTGTLVLGGADSYGSGAAAAPSTQVNQGILSVQNATALGLPGNLAEVLDGAQMQVQGGITVLNEALRISGTGINNTGALEGTGGDNHWQGPVTLARDPGFNPATTPPTTVEIGALFNGPSDNLTIDGVLGQIAGSPMGLTKVDPGTVTLSHANTYGGLTTVATGALRVENAQALGASGTLANGTVVQSGAALEIDRDPNTLNPVTVATENLTLNGPGTPSVQALTVSGTSGAFNLTFNGKTANGLPYNATAAVVQSNLNGLSSIGGVGGSVSVAETTTAAGNVFTVVFGGSLAGLDVPLMTALGTGGTTATTTLVRHGGSGALRNFRGNNTWAAPIFLASASNLGADAGTTLTVTGTVQNPSANTGLAPSLTKVSPGTVVFPNANTYTGLTTVNAGVLNIQNAAALGVTASSQQIFALSGPNTGSFTLTFSGQTTSLLSANVQNGSITGASNGTPIVITSPNHGLKTGQQVQVAGVGGDINANGIRTVTVIDANHFSLNGSVGTIGGGNGFYTPGTGTWITTTVQNALNALASIGGVGGSVSVAPFPVASGIFQVTFGGTLANQHVAQITGKGLNGTLVTTSTFQDGSWGAVVNTGGTLQVQGGTKVSTKALTITGTGTSAVQQFGVTGPFQLSFNGSLPTSTLSPTATGDQVAAALDALSTIGGVGGSVAVTLADGVYTVVFGGSLAGTSVPILTPYITTISPIGPIVTVTPAGGSQQIALSGSRGWFTLTFNTATTYPLAVGSTAAQVAAALNVLQSIGGVSGSAAVSLSGGVYTVTFGDTLTGTTQPISGTGVIAAVTAGGLGALDSPSGANTWDNILTLQGNASVGADIDTSGLNPVVSTLVIDKTINESSTTPGSALTKVGLGTTTLSGNTSNTYSGGTLVNDGVLQLNKTGGGSTVAVTPNMAGSPAKVVSQLLTVTPGSGTGFTLTVNGQTTATLADGASALQVQVALAALASIGSVTNVAVASSVANVYTVTFSGTAATNGQPTLSGTGIFAIGKVVIGDASPVPIQIISDVLRLLGSNQMPANVPVAVNGDGLFDLNGQKQAVGSLNMTGGIVSITGPTAVLTLNGNVTASADAFFNSATIQDAGTLSLGGATRTFTVAGPSTLYADLIVSAPIAGTLPTDGILKLGTGTLALTHDNSYTGLTTISKGTLLADGVPTGNTTAAVSLNGGTLGGNGSVGPVTATTTAGNVLMPGDGIGIPPGTLNINTTAATPTVLVNAVPVPGSVPVPSAGSFFVELNHPGDGASSLLTVTGPAGNTGPVINLNNATLNALLDPAIAIGDSFTIIQTTHGTVSGHFFQQFSPNTVFFGGRKFTVQYINNAVADTGTVILTRALDTATVSLTSSVNPSVYGQDVAFTATVVPEPGGGALPTSDTITFTVSQGASTLYTTVPGININSSDQAVFDLKNYPSIFPLTPGTYTINAIFNADHHDITYNTIGATTPVTQKVNQASVSYALSSTPAHPVPGQAVTVTATLTAQAPGAGVPTGTLTFFVDGVQVPGTAPTLSGGIAKSVLTFAAAGAHVVTETYSGDADFRGSTSPNGYTITVTKGTAVFSITGNPASTSVPQSPVYGEMVTFSVTLTGPIAPTGTVTFYDGAIIQTDIIGSQLLSAISATQSSASVTTVTPLPVGTQTINVTYPGDTSFNSGSGSLGYTVYADPTTTTLVTSANPATFGQSIRYTASVSANLPGAGTPTGSVTFFDGATSLGSVALTGAATDTAILAVNNLAAGSNHSITAKYLGNVDFKSSTSSPPIIQVVQIASSVTVKVAPSPSVYGQALNVTASVAAMSPGSGNPADGETLSFYDGTVASGTLLGTAMLDPGGHTPGVAILNLPNGLSVSGSPHTITVSYPGDSIFFASTGTASETVNKASTSTILTSSGPTVFGQTATFTATVKAVSPGAGNPSGTVTFYDGAIAASNQIGTGTLSTTSGVTTTTFSDAALSVATHTIYAVYAGDGNFLTSQTSAAQAATQVVSKAGTTTTLTWSSTTSPSDPVYGQAITLNATVAPAYAGVTAPSGTVNFYDGAIQPSNLLGSGTLSTSSGVTTATFTTSVPLSVATHSLNALYTDDTNYVGSSTASPTTVTVDKDATNTTVTSSANPSDPGASVTFSATVTAASPGSGTPTGTVDFYDGLAIPADQIGSGTLSSGAATFATSTLVSGPHTILAGYADDSHFLPSTSAGFPQVVRYTSVVTITSSGTPSVYGQGVTFTASIQAAAPNTNTPPDGETVTFYDGAKSLGTATLDPLGTTPGVATFTTSGLGVGTHTVTVQYAGDGTFTPGTSATPVSQVVNPASTSTTVSSSWSTSPSDPVFGQTITFTGTVSVTGLGGGNPTGTVTFYDGSIAPANAIGSGTLSTSGGVTTATLNFASLGVGPHSIYAAYQGSTDYNGSPSSGFVSLTVDPDGTSTTLVSSKPTSTYGQSVTFSVTVAASSPGSGTPSGTVTFFDGDPTVPANAIGTGGLDNNGHTTFADSTLAFGVHTITAVYGGSSTFGTSSAAVTQTVVYASTTAVSSAPNPSTYGSAVVLTATISDVAPGTGDPTGSVTFYDGTAVPANALGSGAVSTNLSGVTTATFTTSALTGGTHSINATYVPDNSSAFAGSTTTSALTHTVNVAPTSATITPSVTSSTYGGAVTWTVTVAPTVPLGPGTTNPTGTVTFYDGPVAAANKIGTGALSTTSGVTTTTFSTSTLAVGIYSINASYGGDTNFGTSSTTTASALTVKQSATTTTVVASDSTPVYSESVTFTATVSGGGPPAGTVNFYDGTIIAAHLLGSATLDATGKGTLALKTLVLGGHSISAVYVGNANDAGSQSTTPAAVTVSQDGTNISMSSSSSTSVVLQAVTFSATVTAAGLGTAVPTGTVTFYDGSISPANKIGSGAVNSSGVAIFTTSSLAAGNHNIFVQYGGDTHFKASNTTTAFVQTVQAQVANSLSASGSNPNGAMTPFSIAVTALDTQGRQDLSYNQVVNIVLVSGPAGGRVTGTLTGTFVNGVFTFSNLKLTVVGTYVVQISSGSLPPIQVTITTSGGRFT